MQYFNEVLSFIRQSFLRKDEQLEVPESIEGASLIDIHIVKRTARTLRIVGIFTVARENDSEIQTSPDQQLLRWTVGKRAVLEDNQQTFDWLAAGWIIKEVRFKSDGRSVERIQYRLGYRLHLVLLNKQSEDQQELFIQWTHIQSNIAREMNQVHYLHEERQLQLKDLALFLLDSSTWGIDDLKVQGRFPTQWNLSKRIYALHFILATHMISSTKELFDWKEIGAQYYPGIGGSKSFDGYKAEFLELLATISSETTDALGMISDGQITPIYFAGDVEGTWSKFCAGPVHALTNISVLQDQYSTKATTIWLVENRAILTRMSAEPLFLQETNSLIICVDGHLRSAHKLFIRQLLQSSYIEQAIFWSDYDEAGLQIAGEMLQSLSGHEVKQKWICPDHSIIKNWFEYKQRMELILLNVKSEQEIVLGEAKDWKSWIHH